MGTRVFELVVRPWLKPACTRTIEIAEDHTLEDLHRAIRRALDAHPYFGFGFSLSNVHAVDDCLFLPEPGPRDARKITLGELQLEVGARFLHLVDFSFDQHHLVDVGAIREVPKPLRKPKLIAREGARPRHLYPLPPLECELVPADAATPLHPPFPPDLVEAVSAAWARLDPDTHDGPPARGQLLRMLEVASRLLEAANAPSAIDELSEACDLDAYYFLVCLSRTARAAGLHARVHALADGFASVQRRLDRTFRFPPRFLRKVRRALWLFAASEATVDRRIAQLGPGEVESVADAVLETCPDRERLARLFLVLGGEEIGGLVIDAAAVKAARLRGPALEGWLTRAAELLGDEVLLIAIGRLHALGEEAHARQLLSRFDTGREALPPRTLYEVARCCAELQSLQAAETACRQLLARRWIGAAVHGATVELLARVLELTGRAEDAARERALGEAWKAREREEWRGSGTPRRIASAHSVPALQLVPALA